ncbi:MAG: PSP1 domain-containing protein, partial [Planctomycetota bacterium]
MVNRQDTSYCGIVRFGRAGRVRKVMLQEAGLVRGERLVVRSDRGTELATLVQSPVRDGQTSSEAIERELWRLRSEEFWCHIEARPEMPSSSGETPPTVEGEVQFLRRASSEDLERVEQQLPREEAEALLFFQSKIEELRLSMRPIEVEMTRGGERITFYFAADHRVDFRELVRVLARKYQTRVELRRINPREVAALQGSLGICGREVCCRSWL